MSLIVLTVQVMFLVKTEVSKDESVMVPQLHEMHRGGGCHLINDHIILSCWLGNFLWSVEQKLRGFSSPFEKCAVWLASGKVCVWESTKKGWTADFKFFVSVGFLCWALF